MTALGWFTPKFPGWIEFTGGCPSETCTYSAAFAVRRAARPPEWSW
ncbi:hypothetical protein AB0B25_12740 [Nocardia sp. NPDC049190]